MMGIILTRLFATLTKGINDHSSLRIPTVHLVTRVGCSGKGEDELRNDRGRRRTSMEKISPTKYVSSLEVAQQRFRSCRWM